MVTTGPAKQQESNALKIKIPNSGVFYCIIKKLIIINKNKKEGIMKGVITFVNYLLGLPKFAFNCFNFIHIF